MSEEDKWYKIIEALHGTYNSLPVVLDQYGREDLEDHMPFLQTLDNVIFLCTSCGWWCEIGEATESETGEDVCSQCADEVD